MHDSSPEPLTLRLLTLNIHKGFSVFNRRFILPELREAIRAFSADVVCLQEVLGEHSGHQSRHPGWPLLSQYEFLADSIWPQHAYGRNAVYTEGHHGNAVLSKYAVVSYRNYDISISGPEQRGMLHCVLALPGNRPPLHLITVHLSLTEGHRQQQLARLCAVVAEQVPANAPLVVAGDFNDWRGRAHAVLAREAGLEEVYLRSTGRAALSFPARWPLLRLDRIYVRQIASAAPVLLTKRPWSHLSDHIPLGAELLL
ncbi:MAG: endonuclease/exonuclease/phosphatase family protein [Pseudomonadota bacterium]